LKNEKKQRFLINKLQKAKKKISTLFYLICFFCKSAEIMRKTWNK